MASQGLAGLLAGVSCLLVTTLCGAQCSMDKDCAGELVCEARQCVEPAPLPPAPPAPAGPAPAAATAPAGPTRASIADEPRTEPRELPPPKPKMRRHSTAMMVGGIVMTSIGGIALAVSATATLSSLTCNTSDSFDSSGGGRSCRDNDTAIYSSLVLGLGLIAGGVPMLIIGAKRKPVGYASLTPWAAPQGGGLLLHLDL